ncbi:MAG: hypothetical protein ACLRS2_20295 [[Clostridium] innocuum]
MRAVTDIINILCLQQNLIIQGTIAAIAKGMDSCLYAQWSSSWPIAIGAIAKRFRISTLTDTKRRE